MMIDVSTFDLSKQGEEMRKKERKEEREREKFKV